MSRLITLPDGRQVTGCKNYVRTPCPDLLMTGRTTFALGLDADAQQLVLVSNGDTDARNVAVVGAGYSGKTKTWYVYLSNSVNRGDMFRVNYCILIRQ